MAFRARWVETDANFAVSEGATLLESALAAGVSLPNNCRGGACGTCRVRLVEGAVHYAERPLALEPEDEAAGFALACQALPRSDVVISVAPPEPMAPPQIITARVVGVRAVGTDVAEVRLAADESIELEFLPGQHLDVLLADGARRSFSMASIPGAGEVVLHVRRIPGGRFTAGELGRLEPGDALRIEMPLGTFHYHAEDDRQILMVATGTGLAPIRSMLEDLLENALRPPIALYWGARTAADLYAHEELSAWASRHEEFDYVPVLSRAGPEWNGRRGRVQHAVAQDLPDLSDYAIYLCGSAAMVADAKAAFIAGGAEERFVHTDSYTFQSSREHGGVAA
jgi:CDP-4-dehydro-6-deoxyglucose reductase, E3